MEVHTHTHPASGGTRKKWTHYLWEFLMLFLAVFCGFLAENIREHQIEHRREKQFMQSLVSDLTEDTAQIRESIATATKAKQYQDSILYYLYLHPPTDYFPNFYRDTLSWNSLPRLGLTFNEVTALQLKNAGNLRLIRKQEVVRKISLYWMEQENTRVNLDRYLVYRNRGREFEEKLYAYSDNDLAEIGLITLPDSGFRVINKEPAIWSEFSNIISHCRITTSQFIRQLEKLMKMGSDLIEVLKREYHLE